MTSPPVTVLARRSRGANRVRRCEGRDIDAVSALTLQAFGVAAESRKWTDSGWILEGGSAIVGALLAEPRFQYFGGRPIPAAAIGSVVVAPEARGRGVGRTLVSRACDALQQDGLSLACLYPTIVPFYRSLGFEIAGARTTYVADASALPAARVRGVERWGSEELPGVRACYEAVARTSNGLLGRDERHWDALLAPSSPSYRYVVRQGGVVTGYMIYTRIPEGDFFSARCHDLLWRDEAAASSLLSVLACQRPLLRAVTWPGAAVDRTAMVFDQWQTRRSDLLWMLRALDVAQAIAGRGYPTELSVQLDLDVTGPRAGRTDRLSIEITAGVATVKRRRGAGSSATDSATFAALFAGWLTPREAQVCGRLSTSTPAELTALQWMFGGPSPWMLDRF